MVVQTGGSTSINVRMSVAREMGEHTMLCYVQGLDITEEVVLGRRPVTDSTFLWR